MSDGNFTVKDGTCYLFENRFKKKDTHPDLVGDMVLTKSYQPGDKIKLMGYIRKTKGGKDFVYIMESNYDPQTHSTQYGNPDKPKFSDPNAPREYKGGRDAADDDIPF